MTPIPGWRKLWWRLWSVKLSLLAALLSGLEVAFAVYVNGQPPVFAAVAMILSVSAAVARCIAQPKLPEYDG